MQELRTVASKLTKGGAWSVLLRARAWIVFAPSTRNGRGPEGLLLGTPPSPSSKVLHHRDEAKRRSEAINEANGGARPKAKGRRGKKIGEARRRLAKRLSVQPKSEQVKASVTKGREAIWAHCRGIVRNDESSCNPLHVVGLVTLPGCPWNIPRCWQLKGS